MNISTLYYPTSGTLAYEVVEFFRRNPDEALSQRDVDVKWGFGSPDEAGLQLRGCARAGLLDRRPAGTEWEWSAGPRLRDTLDPAWLRQRVYLLEALLRRARSGLPMTDQRRAVLRMLAELEPGQWAATPSILDTVGNGLTLSVLDGMEACGLLDKRRMTTDEYPMPHGGRPAIAWRLAPGVEVPA